jgi:hypothetical protein
VRVTRILRAILFASLAAASASPARAQSPDAMLPEQSEAKARQVIQQAIRALGGAAYLGVKDVTCSGRLSSFEHSGAVTGTIKFINYVKLPDKDRTEFYSKTYTDIIITELHKTNITAEVHNGNRGWTLNGGGVDELPAEAISARSEQQKKSINVLLRERLQEPGLTFRWGGYETIDLRRFSWVEVSDTDHHTLRVAFDDQTHLPSRSVYQTLDPASREHNEEIEYLSNFHTVQGVGTPFQRARERNGLKFFQVFYDECKYNTGLDDSMFTMDSLEKLFAKHYKEKKSQK